MKTVIINPSDFTFLWKECPRCFYLKARHKINRPQAPFPGIFSSITSAIKQGMNGRSLKSIDASFPSGQLLSLTQNVNATPLPVKKYDFELVIRGIVDMVIELDGDEEEFAIAKLLTADLTDEQIVEDYWLQMHALLRSVEYPGFGGYTITPITKMGIVVFKPGAYSIEDGLKGNLRWVEIPIDREGFKEDLRELVKVLGAAEDQVTPGDKCSFCTYSQTIKD